MNPQQTNTAHSLYALYETLPDDVEDKYSAWLTHIAQQKALENESVVQAAQETSDPANIQPQDEEKGSDDEDEWNF